VIPALIAAGHRVRGLYRSRPADFAIKWEQADLTKTQDYGPLLAGCDSVIHLAAALAQPEVMDAVNVEATRRLVAESCRQGIRYFGYASSIVVYGSPRERFVDEDTLRIDPFAPVASQYHAEPYMLEYARTKAAAEIAIEALNAPMVIDFYRPAVVVTDAELLLCRDWSLLRKLFASYRRTQFITAIDTAAAIVHLMERGLKIDRLIRAPIEAYNIVEKRSLNYRSLFADAYQATGDARFRVVFDIPVVMDFVKDFVRYRNMTIRYPLGMLELSAEKLIATGFVFPIGIDRAIRRAVCGRVAKD
jgi:nucleoside-diphosphate-sugar epimerase